MSANKKTFEVIRLTPIPNEPDAGTKFLVVVELDREVPMEGQAAVVAFEKQRIVADSGGFPITRPTGERYFQAGFEPQPVEIMAGSRFGISSPIMVLKGAEEPAGDPPIHFPESLLLTAFIGNLQERFCSQVIRIQGPQQEKSFQLEAYFAPGDLVLGEFVPNRSERDVVGAATTRIVRGTPEFAALVQNNNPDIVFKDEEHTGADRMMTSKLKSKVDRLATLVRSEWPGLKLRVTEAWDEDMEHGANSVHYEARAVDITTSDQDSTKLGRLGRLAVNAGFEWVFYENEVHIHASVSA